MDIFKAVAQVKKGKCCRSMLGDTEYVLFPRVTANYNYDPPKTKTVLGVQKRNGDTVISCVELPPVMMCHTDWELCEFDEVNSPWHILIGGLGIG